MYNFSILVASWNNLNHLKVFIDSVEKNTSVPYELIVFVNEDFDGTTKWLEQNQINYLYSSENKGICTAYNELAKVATREWLCICEDDTYLLPGWDIELIEFHKNNNFTDNIWLASTYIEKNGMFSIKKNYGNINNFQKDGLLKDYKSFIHQNYINISTTPVLLKRKLWEKVKGFSLQFSPGIGSEIDLAKKLWDEGVRNFVSVGKSLVYHFQSISTNKIEDRRKQGLRRDRIFQKLYNMPIEEFRNKYLRKGDIWNGS